MGYCTFKQAKGFCEDGAGECGDAKLGKIVNTARQHFYSWYQELSLFLDAVECFRLQRFYVDCNDCSDWYQGVTLPRDFQTVEAMWFNDWPIPLQSSWREFQTGIASECDCRLEKIDVAGAFPTALDITARHPSRVVVRAFDEADTGKRIVVRGVANSGQRIMEEMALSPSPTTSQAVFKSIDRAGGVVKAQTKGQVYIGDEDSRMLSIYEPSETVPNYRRIKITGLPSGCEVVNVRASRRFFPLTGDDDVVEIDNAAAFDAMARYLRLYERADKTSESIRAEKDHYQTARGLIMGDKSRELGKGTQASITFLTPRFGGGRRLNRGGGW